MGTRRYILAGKGNPARWLSCSHGARTPAQLHAGAQAVHVRRPGQGDGRKGCGWPGRRVLDEIPAAYKDIDQVIADQNDLVEVLRAQQQVLNDKGT